jgi:hypothetical protein
MYLMDPGFLVVSITNTTKIVLHIPIIKAFTEFC